VFGLWSSVPVCKWLLQVKSDTTQRRGWRRALEKTLSKPILYERVTKPSGVAQWSGVCSGSRLSKIQRLLPTKRMARHGTARRVDWSCWLLIHKFQQREDEAWRWTKCSAQKLVRNNNVTALLYGLFNGTLSNYKGGNGVIMNELWTAKNMT
jgi:hypothetical protein